MKRLQALVIKYRRHGANVADKMQKGSALNDCYEKKINKISFEDFVNLQAG